ncbi:MAG: DUF5060 domain-containing protein, partial [Acidobacteria bacterium]|nr:DUF5060 domain-containing protein [Acidobacteriota bacterium]
MLHEHFSSTPCCAYHLAARSCSRLFDPRRLRRAGRWLVQADCILVCLVTLTCCPALQARTTVTGELKRWHRVTLTFDGPQSGEDATPNPFRNYRLNVTFTHKASGKSYTAPGYYAA